MTVTLTPPEENTVLVKYGKDWKQKKWHILKGDSKEKGICGVLCIDPEHKLLSQVKKHEICSICYQLSIKIEW